MPERVSYPDVGNVQLNIKWDSKVLVGPERVDHSALGLCHHSHDKSEALHISENDHNGNLTRDASSLLLGNVSGPPQGESSTPITLRKLSLASPLEWKMEKMLTLNLLRGIQFKAPRASLITFLSRPYL